MGKRAMTVQQLLGRHMRATRDLAGIKQGPMAARLGVKQPYVSQLEQGEWVNIDPLKLLEYVKIGLDVTAVLRQWIEEQRTLSDRRAARRARLGSTTPLAGDVFVMTTTSG